MVNKANLGKTCGKCHPDAGQRFTIGSVHTLAASSPAGGRALDFVKTFYLLAIPCILGFMLVHNFLDWWRKARRVLEQYRQGHGQMRLTLNERTQHVLLLVSFIMLVVTGFALKYPHSFWAEPLVQWEKNIPLRGWIHRLAGVVLMVGSVYHVIYLITKSDGRRWVKDMLPKVRDVREAVQTVGYNLGYRSSLPRYARFNYMEKAEYWALVWGTIVMAITGVLLWAHNWVLAYLPFPVSILDVTTAVHFYEAILATFSILIWHFYAVIFDPDVYPIKWTLVTGRAPEHEVREESEEEPPPTPPSSPDATTGENSPPTTSSPDGGPPPDPSGASDPDTIIPHTPHAGSKGVN
jgi:formate dehydrogenase gamma subunit